MLNKKTFFIVITTIIIIALFLGLYFILINNKLNENSDNLSVEEKIFKKYRQQITLDFSENKNNIDNLQISFKINTSALIREGKLSFDCGNIEFIDPDGEIKIPHWIEGNCGKVNTVFWLNIQDIKPKQSKIIFMEYGDNPIINTDGFNEVFPKNDDLVGWYYLNSTNKDFSNNNNEGKFFDLSYNDNHYWYYNWSEKDNFVSFHNLSMTWMGANTYFEVPSTFNKAQGALELWVMPIDRLRGSCREECPLVYKRLFVDTKWDMELGLDLNNNLYFYPSQAPGDNYSLIENPLNQEEWNHIVVNWDFSDKKIEFYINGEKRNAIIDNISKSWTRVAETGMWQFGGTELEMQSGFTGGLDGIRIYNKPISSSLVPELYQENSRSIRFPSYELGSEEIINEGFDPYLPVNLGEIIQIPVTNEVILNPYYFASYEGKEPMVRDYRNNVNPLISKHTDELIPVFGMGSHFYPYEGAPIKTENKYLLTHLKLEINSPSKIKDLEIEFKEISTLNTRKNTFSTPIVYACGPYYSYSVVGRSKLSPIEDISNWYKLDVPIFIDEDTENFQLHYIPSGESGELTITLDDVILINENKEYVRPVLSKKLFLNEDRQMYFTRFSESGTKSPAEYYTFLAREER